MSPTTTTVAPAAGLRTREKPTREFYPQTCPQHAHLNWNTLATLALSLSHILRLHAIHPLKITLRSDPAAVAQLLATRSPPTFECLLGTVLPALIAQVSTASQRKKPRIGEYGGGQEGREEDAIRAVCRVAASVALSQGQSHSTFRNRVCKSGLRELGLLGKEAEVALAEEFSSGNASRPK